MQPFTLKQSEALGIINDYLPDHIHLLFDAGNCAAAAAHYINAPSGSNASIALGMGGMGYGVASSIGVQLARKNNRLTSKKPTVVFCGDGAFLMNGFEIHTAVEHKLPILWLVFNNNKHGMCVTRQQQYFDARIECSAFKSPLSISTISRGFGDRSSLWIARARSIEELHHSLTEYWQQNRPMPGVLELMINVEEIPPFIPFLINIQQASQAPHSTASPTSLHRSPLPEKTVTEQSDLAPSAA